MKMFPTYEIRTGYYGKRMQVRDGAVFSMALNEGFAVGRILFAKFDKGVGRLIEILDIVPDLDFDDLDAWVADRHRNPLIPSFQVNSGLFTQFGMCQRIGTVAVTESQEDYVYLIARHVVYDPYSRVFVPQEMYGVEPDRFSGSRAGWDLVAVVDPNNRLKTHEERESAPLVSHGAFFPAYVDLFVARAVRFRQGRELPIVQYEDQDKENQPGKQGQVSDDVVGELSFDSQLESVDGSYLLSFATGETGVEDVVRRAGHEPNGYFWEGVATYLIDGEVVGGDIRLDSEAGRFSVQGSRSALERLQGQLGGLVNDQELLTALLDEAEESGFDFDD